MDHNGEKEVKKKDRYSITVERGGHALGQLGGGSNRGLENLVDQSWANDGKVDNKLDMIANKIGNIGTDMGRVNELDRKADGIRSDLSNIKEKSDRIHATEDKVYNIECRCEEVEYKCVRMDEKIDHILAYFKKF